MMKMKVFIALYCMLLPFVFSQSNEKALEVAKFSIGAIYKTKMFDKDSSKLKKFTEQSRVFLLQSVEDYLRKRALRNQLQQLEIFKDTLISHGTKKANQAVAEYMKRFSFTLFTRIKLFQVSPKNGKSWKVFLPIRRSKIIRQIYVFLQKLKVSRK